MHWQLPKGAVFPQRPAHDVLDEIEPPDEEEEQAPNEHFLSSMSSGTLLQLRFLFWRQVFEQEPHVAHEPQA